MGSTIRAHEAAGPPAATPMVTSAQTLGNDVSGYQPWVDWGSVAANGGQFAYVKATEGTTYTSPSFASQYNGSANAGLVRGAYHFGLPDVSSGSSQANFFVGNGGGWSADGRTLPPMLDIEYNPYTQAGHDTCYSLSPGQMVSWIADFSTTVQSRTGRYPLIYTTTAWWNTCTGSSPAFASTNPLFLARYGATPGTLPAGWASQTLWQYSDSGIFPGDQDQFNGTTAQLGAFTTQTNVPAPVHTGATLTAGQALYPPASGLTNPNSSMVSPNQQYRLYQQSDGNLVEYGNGGVPFSTGTYGRPGSTTVMQSDGNLVTYAPDGTTPLFDTHTYGNPGSQAVLQNDGNLVVYAPNGRALWASYGAADLLGSFSSQTSPTLVFDRARGSNGEQYLTSLDYQRTARVGDNGLTVVTAGRPGPDFSTSVVTASSDFTLLEMQSDGNLVLSSCSAGTCSPIWSSLTYGNPGAHARMQTDGNLVVYTAGGQALWSSVFGRTY